MKKSWSNRIFWILSLLLFSSWQGHVPVNYFRSPVDYSFSLSGSFGEIRQNHFHSGIDIRTGGVQGKPVYAVADGYVTRINVSPSGFGKALYIAHPNGYTSVYGHLKSYAGNIGSWIRAFQYKQESFAVDTEVPQGLLKVKKGDVIAYSGNSGSSGGPHLHFEIRDSRTQETIDPLEFGIKTADATPPQIRWIKIYPMDDNAMVNQASQPVLMAVSGRDGVYSLKSTDTVTVSGNIIFGIETLDYAGSSGLHTGVHTIQLAVDGVQVYSHSLDHFLFSETRYVNSLMDYPAFIRNKQKIQRSYIAPNNKLSAYGKVINRGIINFSDRRSHQIQYTVLDVFGNSAKLVFFVKSNPPSANAGIKKVPAPNSVQQFKCKSDNLFERNDIQFSLPEGALYEDLNFEYTASPPAQGVFSRVHHLQNQFVPLQTFCTLSIRPVNLPKNLMDKALIVKMGAGNYFSSAGGKYENGKVTTQIRDFGDYAVSVDTTSPVIRPVNIFNNKKVGKQSTIAVKITDNLSGIKTYRATLNGRWILMDYDLKSHQLTYVFDEHIHPGKNVFLLTVTDAYSNSARYEASLLR